MKQFDGKKEIREIRESVRLRDLMKRKMSSLPHFQLGLCEYNLFRYVMNAPLDDDQRSNTEQSMVDV